MTLQHRFRRASLVRPICGVCQGRDSVPLVMGDRHDLGLVFVLCTTCGTGRLAPRPDDRWFDLFYKDFYWPLYLNAEWRQQFDEGRVRGGDLLRAIEDGIPSNVRSILDYGCGAGGTLSVFAERFPAASSFGFEPAEFNHRELAGIPGIQTVTRLPDQKFDLIVSTHVLEHEREPTEAIRTLGDRLTSDGRLYLEVPDLLSEKWWGKDFFHIAHLQYFSEWSLRYAVCSAGLEVEQVYHGPIGQWPWAIGVLCRKASVPGTPEDWAATPEHLAACQDFVAARMRSDDVPVPPWRAAEAGGEPARSAPGVGSLSLRHQIRARVGRWVERLSPKAARVLRRTSHVARGGVETQIQQLTSRIQGLEEQLAEAGRISDVEWLSRNRVERMDPTVDGLFDPKRGEFHLARYRFAAQFVDGKDVADVACGTGYGSELLVESGANRVYGIDIDAAAVAYAQRAHGGPRTRFLARPGDATALADESVDVVASFETIEHVPDDDRLLRELHRILRPGGWLICSTPNEWPLEFAPCHLRVYSRQSFEEVVARHFRLVSLWSQNSGFPSPFNHGQPANLRRTIHADQALAECYVVVARKSG